MSTFEMPQGDGEPTPARQRSELCRIGTCIWRRRRGLIKTLKIVLVVLLPGLIGYGWLAIRFYTSKPNPTRDFLAEFNAPIDAADPDDLAWPLYRQGLLMLSEPPLINTTRVPWPGEENWEVIATYLEENQPAFEVLRQAASKPLFGRRYAFEMNEADKPLWPQHEDIEELETGLIIWGHVEHEHVNVLLKLTLILKLDIVRAAIAGETKTLIANVELFAGLADQLRQRYDPLEWTMASMLYGQLVMITLGALGEHDVLSQMSDDDLVRVASAFERFGSVGRTHVNYESWRAEFEDLLQHMYSDDGNGDGRMTPLGFEFTQGFASLNKISLSLLERIALPLQATRMESRSELTDLYTSVADDLQAAAETPLWDRDLTIQSRFDRGLTSITRKSRGLLGLVTRGLSKATVALDRSLMLRDAAITTIAAHRYRRRFGAWPVSLDELVAAILKDAPIDRFTGEPLGFRIVDDRPLIYSRGTDGDDDGGRPTADDGAALAGPLGDSTAARADGDWVFFPVSKYVELDPLKLVDSYDPEVRKPAFVFPWFDEKR